MEAQPDSGLPKTTPARFRPRGRLRRPLLPAAGLLALLAAAAAQEGARPAGIAAGLAGRAPAEAAAGRAEVSVEIGERLADFGRRLERRGLGSAGLLGEIARREPLAEYPFLPPRAAARRFEGMFPPGRYAIALPAARPGESARERRYRACLAVVRALLGESRRRLEGLELGNDLGLRRTLILASLVEKEAVSRRGYGEVASVFLKRLRHGMRLASCPSVEYALGYHRPFLLRADLAVDSPYNTYRYAGLPPTPICFFSDEALRAAARPAASPFWFFLFDWTRGELVFSTGYAEHARRAVEARRNYGRLHGADRMYRKYPGLFYEPVPREPRPAAGGSLLTPARME